MSFEFAEYFTHYAADFAFSCISANSFQDERDQVGLLIFMASIFQCSQSSLNLSIVAFCLNISNLLSLQFAYRTIYAEQILRGFFFLSELVNANDNAFALFNIHLPFISRILNFFLDVTLSNCFRSAAQFINLLNVVHSFFLDLVGQSFYIVGTAERIDGVSQAGLVSYDLLSTQSDGYGFSGRQSQSFILGVGVQGLSATHYSCCNLQSNTNDVVVRLLSGQHRTSGLGMETQHHGFSFLCMETILHDASPNTTASTILSNFFQYVVMSIPEEGQTACKGINVHTSLQSCFYVSNTISDGECKFLSSGGAGFTNVVTGNGNGVPQRYVRGAIFENVGD